MVKEKIIPKKEEISKMAVDEKKLKSTTIPNPVVTGGLEEIGLRRIQPIEIPKYLLMHPALPRGIELKANRMIKLVDDDLEENIIINPSGHAKAKEARGYCKKILYDSGGPLYLKKLAQGAYRFGTSFSILQTDVAESEVLKFEYQHEIFFGPAKYPKVLKGQGVDWGEIPMNDRKFLAGKMKINLKTKRIARYTQLTFKTKEGWDEHNWKWSSAEYVNTRTHPALKERTPGDLLPVGLEYPEDMVIQLAFDTIGDEPLGISLIQFLHLTIKYLLNMERAGAQTMVNFGFNKWKANTPFKDRKKMEEFGRHLSNINTDAVVILPKEITLDNIKPERTEFDKIQPIYLKLIAIRLGIPLPLLTQEGTETNRATIQEQRKDMYDDFIADELTIQGTINDGFFKACKIRYPDMKTKELEKIVPKFIFKQPPEDKDVEQERDLKFSLMIRNFATAAKFWSEAGGEGGVVDNIGTKINILIGESVPKDTPLTEGKKPPKKIPGKNEKKSE